MNVTLLVASCDKYKPLWDNFFTLIDRYWKIPCDKVFIGETVDPNKADFKVCLPGSKEWGERVLEGLKLVETDYVLFLLEDYYLNYKYSDVQMIEWLYIMMYEDGTKEGWDRLQISPSGGQRYINHLGKFKMLNPKSDYLISMQPSLWRVGFLKEVLEPQYSPWDFEITGTNKLRKQRGVPKIFIDTSVPDVYFNAVRRGMKRNKGLEDFLKQENLPDIQI